MRIMFGYEPNWSAKLTELVPFLPLVDIELFSSAKWRIKHRIQITTNKSVYTWTWKKDGSYMYRKL